jgi:hypothetical protein
MKTARVSAFAILVLFASGDPAPAGDGYVASPPVTRGNMALHFIRGPESRAATPLTLQQALSSGQAIVHESRSPLLRVENLSDRPLFIPAGELLTGGVQDRVVAFNTIVRPFSSDQVLAYCADPFRSSPREGESAVTFAAAGALLPWTASLRILWSGPHDARGGHKLRQLGVWWGADTLVSQLSARIGVEPAPAETRSWSVTAAQRERIDAILRDRRTRTEASLPHILDAGTLRQALQPYLGIAPPDHDVVGVAVVINGEVRRADVYGSAALFRQLWPKLLQAYAIEALARQDGTHAVASAEVIDAFLAAGAGASREATPIRGGALRESEHVVVAQASTADGEWLARTYLSRTAATEPAGAPEAAIADILQRGVVAGRTFATIAYDEDILLWRADGQPGWAASIRQAKPAPARTSGSDSTTGIVILLMAMAALTLFRRRMLPAERPATRAAAPADRSGPASDGDRPWHHPTGPRIALDVAGPAAKRRADACLEPA